MHLMGIRHRRPNVFDIVISANTTNWSLADELLEQFGFNVDTDGQVIVSIQVETGVVVRASNTSNVGMDLDLPNHGSVISLNNDGDIQGRGGAGGAGGAGITEADGGDGGAGTAAIKGPGTGNTLRIFNSAGYIWGGGGGGGGGGGVKKTITPGGEPSTCGCGGGGGGGGAGGGAAGSAGSSFIDTGSIDSPSEAGTAGSTGHSGTFGTGGDGAEEAGSFNINGGDGRNGGDWGTAGTAGTINGGNGGAAGKAIDDQGGTVEFVNGNTAERVKGAVS